MKKVWTGDYRFISITAPNAFRMVRHGNIREAAG
jgi:hypothetical protein